MGCWAGIQRSVRQHYSLSVILGGSLQDGVQDGHSWGWGWGFYNERESRRKRWR